MAMPRPSEDEVIASLRLITSGITCPSGRQARYCPAI